MDYALLNLGLTFALLFVGFLLRRRILAALGRLLFEGSVKFARATLLDEGTEVGPDGEKRPYVRLRPSGEALLGAVVPVMLAQALKSIKLKPGAPAGLPPGLDLSNLTEALPAILPMLPKRWQGLAALAAPFLGQLLGGGSGRKPAEPATENPFLKELKR